MRKFTVVLLTILLMLTMSLPAMAQGAQNNSPVQRTSYEVAKFSGLKGSTNTYISLVTDYENEDQYILYVDKYNYETSEMIGGKVKIPKSEVVFKTNKGTVKVSKTVPLNKIEWVYDEASNSKYPIETYLGDESINLTWSFDPKADSSQKSFDRKIQIGFNEYLQVGKYTYKDYYNVTVTGNIGDMEIADFDNTNASIMTGTSFQVIK